MRRQLNHIAFNLLLTMCLFRLTIQYRFKSIEAFNQFRINHQLSEETAFTICLENKIIRHAFNLSYLTTHESNVLKSDPKERIRILLGIFDTNGFEVNLAPFFNCHSQIHVQVELSNVKFDLYYETNERRIDDGLDDALDEKQRCDAYLRAANQSTLTTFRGTFSGRFDTFTFQGKIFYKKICDLMFANTNMKILQLKKMSDPANPHSSAQTANAKSVCRSGRKWRCPWVPSKKPLPKTLPLPTAILDCMIW